MIKNLTCEEIDMSVPAKKRATYDDLYSIPENMTGEIIDGELYATPRPSRKHGITTFDGFVKSYLSITQ